MHPYHLLSCLLICPQGQEAERFPDFPEQDALSYELSLDVDPAGRRLRGAVRYGIRADAPLRRIRLHATRSETFEVVFRDRGGAEMPAEWEEDLVYLTLPEEAPAGATVAFTAELEGTPPDGFYFKDSRYGDPLAFTDHYSIRARGWLPCEDHPADRARFRVRLTYPEDDEAVVSGGLLPAAGAGEPPAGRKLLTSETRSDIPPYMFAIVVGPYARVAEAGDPRLRPHFVYRQDVEKAKRYLVHHAQWLQTMEEAFGPYPYAKYTTVQCPTRWGGFEAPGNVQLMEALFDRPGGGVGTLAHELVHMWFGDGVGYAAWREVWLSEGFASYFGPWLHEKAGGPALKQSLAAMRASWLRSFEGRTKSVRWDGFPHPDRALNSNTYPKGAWVLHMLRARLGDEAFFDALADWFRTFRGQSVTTADFVRSVEQSTGEELDWFFDQWLDRVGCPRLEVTAREGSIVVDQVQEGPPWRFRLTLQWTGADGEKVRRTLEIEAARTEIEVDGPVRELVVDPDVELLFRPS